MFYHWYEMTHAALSPARAMADATRLYYKNPVNPFTHTQFGRSIAAVAEVFERVTRRYGKPEFGIDTIMVGGERVPVHEEVVWSRPFCRLVRFVKGGAGDARPGPKLLLVAPMSGHYATLLRGTVQDMLPNHDVYITDWVDARMVPMSDGASISMTTSTMSSRCCTGLAAIPTSWPCASHRFRSWPRSRSWKARTTPMCPRR